MNANNSIEVRNLTNNYAEKSGEYALENNQKDVFVTHNENSKE